MAQVLSPHIRENLIRDVTDNREIVSSDHDGNHRSLDKNLTAHLESQNQILLPV